MQPRPKGVHSLRMNEEIIEEDLVFGGFTLCPIEDTIHASLIYVALGLEKCKEMHEIMGHGRETFVSQTV